MQSPFFPLSFAHVGRRAAALLRRAFHLPITHALRRGRSARSGRSLHPFTPLVDHIDRLDRHGACGRRYLTG